LRGPRRTGAGPLAVADPSGRDDGARRAATTRTGVQTASKPRWDTRPPRRSSYRCRCQSHVGTGLGGETRRSWARRAGTSAAGPVPFLEVTQLASTDWLSAGKGDPPRCSGTHRPCGSCVARGRAMAVGVRHEGRSGRSTPSDRSISSFADHSARCARRGTFRRFSCLRAGLLESAPPGGGSAPDDCGR
jgi:hypothetical protein